MHRRLTLLLLALLTSNALAHGGGLNADGCHNNRKTGDYHCHRAPSVAAVRDAQQPPHATSQGAATPQARSERTAPQPGGPTCHVGPRGGTYTITKSGKKNYGGC
jgi:hypothetical protein